MWSYRRGVLYRIDISNFKNSVYFLTIKFDDNTIETCKFIKQ